MISPEKKQALPLHYAQGLLMGGADIIPGVSGGTVALIVGVYERLIDSLSVVFSAALSAVRGQRSHGRAKFAEVEWRLVIPLALGILTAIAVGSQIIPPLMERYPEESRGLFFGLVAASVAIPWLRIDSHGVRELLVVLAAAVIAFVLVGLPPAESADPPLLRVFGSAAVAICAMILPGVSGAFLLEVLGMYEPTLRAIGEIDVIYLLVFVAGAATGLAVFSELLSWLLHHWHDVTMSALTGLMVGSLRALWPWQQGAREMVFPDLADPVAPVILLALVGFASVSVLTWRSASGVREGDESTA